jgi:hypothetical protein
MKIEPLGDWKFRMTSPAGDVVVMQIGEVRIAYSDPHPRITVEEHDQLVQYQISVDGRLTPLKTSTLTRACEFKRRWWDNGWKIGDWEPGKWRAWGTDYEEFETGPGMYPVGVVEDSTGGIHSVYVERIRMEKP